MCADTEEQLLRHPNNTEYTTDYTSICVSSYYYMCVLILVYMCADTGEQLLRHPNIVAYFGVQRHSGVSVHI
jgi:hypothetical protein